MVPGGACLVEPIFCVAHTVVSSTTSSIFGGVVNWVAGSSAWAWHELGSFLAASSSPSVVTATARPEFTALLVVAPMVAVCALLGNVLSSLRRGEASSLVHDVAFTTPLLILAIVSAFPFANLILTVVNALCDSAAVNAAAVIGKLTTAASVFPASTPGFAELLLDFAGVIGALVLWFELVLRNAVLALLLCLSPIVFAAAVWQPVRKLAVRLVETFIAVAVSKFVVVVALALGASATQSSSGEVVITGIAIVLLATFTPFALLRIVPLVELSALHAMDGMRQRAVSATRRAATMAGSAATGMSPTAMPQPPSTPDDLGLDDWPGGPELPLPERPDVRPEPPVGEPTVRGGRVAHLRDHLGPVIGWHFDE
jgi:hypothetical protein